MWRAALIGSRIHVHDDVQHEVVLIQFLEPRRFGSNVVRAGTHKAEPFKPALRDDIARERAKLGRLRVGEHLHFGDHVHVRGG